MGKKTPLGKHSSYEDKVSHFLSKMIDKEVTFKKTDSAAIVDIEKLAYTHHISLPLYWEFAKGQSPGYVAQTIVTKHLPVHLIDYYHEQYVKEWPTPHEYKKPNQLPTPTWNYTPTLTYDYGTVYTSGTITASNITTNKIYGGAANYFELKSAHATKPPLTAGITITPDLEQFHKSMQNLGKAMQQAAENVSKSFKPILEQFEKALAETEKQAALYNAQKMPAKSVLSHPGLQQRVKCPNGGHGVFCREKSLQETIIHLNDIHKWTREKIADWLDTLDEQPIFYPDINFEAEGAESA